LCLWSALNGERVNAPARWPNMLTPPHAWKLISRFDRGRCAARPQFQGKNLRNRSVAVWATSAPLVRLQAFPGTLSDRLDVAAHPDGSGSLTCRDLYSSIAQQNNPDRHVHLRRYPDSRAVGGNCPRLARWNCQIT